MKEVTDCYNELGICFTGVYLLENKKYQCCQKNCDVPVHLVYYSVVSTIPKRLPCSLKICYAVHEIIYTEQHTKLFFFFVCNVRRISRLWESHSPLISSSFW